jgi:hypothetical protein
MWNRTSIVAVSPGVNGDDVGAAQKQQTTGERRRRAVHGASQNSESTERGDVGTAASMGKQRGYALTDNVQRQQVCSYARSTSGEAFCRAW